MEDAKISQDGLYQQGRYPSIIDTDDLVFELGKQVVDRLNKEKLLDTILKKSRMFEDALRKATEAKVVAEKAAADTRNSNEQYIENNKRMDVALVEARKELNIQKKELTDESEATIVELRATITELRAELDDLRDALKASEKKSPKKRSLKKLLKKE